MKKESKSKENNQNKKGAILRGVVVSDKMHKTVVVSVTRYTSHPKYKKFYKISKRYKAHDEQNAYKTGDKVEIAETKPISKDKKWAVVNRLGSSD